MASAPWIVSDELWLPIEPLLPKVERRFRYPGRKRLPDRQALQGILFVLYTGIAWRHLPTELGFGGGSTGMDAPRGAEAPLLLGARHRAHGRVHPLRERPPAERRPLLRQHKLFRRGGTKGAAAGAIYTRAFAASAPASLWNIRRSDRRTVYRP